METRTSIAEELAETLTCSCTGEIFYQPVSTPCGHAFEQEFIQDYINSHKEAVCPQCREKINEKSLVRERKVEELVEKFLKHFPSYVEDQYFPRKHIKTLLEKNDVSEIISIFNHHPNKLNAGIEKDRPLFYVALKSPFSLFRKLIENFATKVDLNAQLKEPSLFNGATLLNYAICTDASKELIEFLLLNGADPSIARSDGVTPLIAAISSKRMDIVDLLLGCKKPLNINSYFVYNGQYHRDNSGDGSSALILGVKTLDANRFAELLKISDIEVNTRNAKGESALFVAAANGQVRKVSLLLQMPDIDVEAERIPGDGMRAVDIATKNQHAEVAKLFSSHYAIFALIRNKLFAADYNASVDLLTQVYPKVDNTIFFESFNSLGEEHCKQLAKPFLTKNFAKVISNNDLTFLKKMLEIGEEKIENQLMHNLLIYAVSAQKYEIIHYLLETFPDIQINAVAQLRDCAHVTALCFAAEDCKDQRILTYLLSKGAEINSQPGFATALLIAAANGNEVAVKVMLESKKCLYDDVKVEPGKTELRMRFYDGYTELYAITKNCSAATLRKFIEVKKDYIRDVNCAFQGTNALLLAIEQNDLEKIKLLCTLPELNLHVTSSQKTILQIVRENNRVELLQFFNCYYLLESLLSHTPIPADISLDAAFAIGLAEQQVIASMLERNGFSEAKINYLINFISQLKSSEKVLSSESHSFFMQYNADEVKMLNALFNFAHQHYFKNKNDWEIKIREQVVTEVLHEAKNKSSDEITKLRLTMREQPVIAKNRFFFSFWHTRSQRKIDEALAEVNENKVCKVQH